MARVIKHEEREGKRNEILDAAQRFIYTRGYEQMSIQDILDELNISKGAFYHYFDSKQALLEGLIERLRVISEREIIPKVMNSGLPAREKLQYLMRESSQWKTEHRDYLLPLLRIWYHDNNAIVRQKSTVSMIQWITPLMAEIIAQGAREGSFFAPSPPAAADVMLSLMLGLGEAIARQILALSPNDDPKTRRAAVARMQDMVAAYTCAIERVLGLATGTFVLMDKKMLKAWLTMPNAPKQDKK